MLVAINAGHCPGMDPGAVGSRCNEADVVDYISRVVCNDLMAVGIEALFIQENELYDICNIANNNNADLFVSIHCNSATPAAEGTETFYCPGSVNGERLAECVQNQLVNTMGTVDRSIKAHAWYVIKHTYMPAILTEIGFISNESEQDYIINHKDEIAHAIARGITDYMQ